MQTFYIDCRIKLNCVVSLYVCLHLFVNFYSHSLNVFLLTEHQMPVDRDSQEMHFDFKPFFFRLFGLPDIWELFCTYYNNYSFMKEPRILIVALFPFTVISLNRPLQRVINRNVVSVPEWDKFNRNRTHNIFCALMISIANKFPMIFVVVVVFFLLLNGIHHTIIIYNKCYSNSV